MTPRLAAQPELSGLAALADLMDRAVRSGWCAALWREPESSTFWLAAAPDAPREAIRMASGRPGFGVATWRGEERMIWGAILASALPGRAIELHQGSPDMLQPSSGAPQWGTEAARADGETVFVQTVESALRLLREGVMDKVVLSRTIHAPHQEAAPWPAFQRLCGRYEGAFCAAVFLPGEGLWMCASPELLVSREPDGRMRTMALAGTRPLPDSGLAEDAAWSQKEIEEQALVSRSIIHEFKRVRLREFREAGPRSAAAGPVAHLRTDYEVDCAAIEREDLPDIMKGLLHPTSATCGMPREAARRFIDRHEPHDRRLYCGYWGPVGVKGASRMYVNLRTMRWMSDAVCIYAGAGITQGSKARQELAETSWKADTLRRILHG
jgi:isochorismate synthase